MSPPAKKKSKTITKKKKTSQSTPNSSLPDELLISCFALVSRLYYWTLSLVSKSFSSLLVSPALYNTRSSLSHTEPCLYVCIRFTDDEPEFRWFTLSRRPDPTITTSDAKKKNKKKSNRYALATLKTPHFVPAKGSGLVTIGSDIYNFGGPINDDNEPSSRVLILDSRSNTWREGRSMLVERRYPVACVLDGKIYVAGGCKGCTSPVDWMEVFDPKTQTWELVSSPGAKTCGCNSVSKIAGVDGKVYIYGNCAGLAYEPREGRCSTLGWEMHRDWPWYSYSVIENVLYSYHEGCFKWYDTKVGFFRILKGLKGLPQFPRHSVRLADYGGKMAVLWERIVARKDNIILCAVIALERRNDEEIWGKVEWQDTVLTVPESCSVEYALATTV